MHNNKSQVQHTSYCVVYFKNAYMKKKRCDRKPRVYFQLVRCSYNNRTKLARVSCDQIFLFLIARSSYEHFLDCTMILRLKKGRFDRKTLVRVSYDYRKSILRFENKLVVFYCIFSFSYIHI